MNPKFAKFLKKKRTFPKLPSFHTVINASQSDYLKETFIQLDETLHYLENEVAKIR